MESPLANKALKIMKFQVLSQLFSLTQIGQIPRLTQALPEADVDIGKSNDLQIRHHIGPMVNLEMCGA